MMTCGISDFTILDILKPDANRLIKQLSGLINFFKFRQDQVENMSAFLNDIESLRQSEAKLINEKNELKNQIKALKCEHPYELTIHGTYMHLLLCIVIKGRPRFPKLTNYRGKFEI